MASPAGDSGKQAGAPSLFVEEKPAELTEEQEKFKRALYEKMRPSRRKFIDRIGYDLWDPFQEPKQPLDMRTENTGRTLEELVRDFMRENEGPAHDEAWKKGAQECALGIFRKDERFQGIYDFCLWYSGQLRDREKK